MGRLAAFGLITSLLLGGSLAARAEEGVFALGSGEEVRAGTRPDPDLIAEVAKPAPAPAPEPFTLTVHLASGGKPVELWRRGKGADELVCAAPCDRPVEMHEGEEFYFAGDGVTRSGTFPFRPRNGQVSLHVNPGRAPLFKAGLATMALGGAAALIGAYIVLDNQACGFVNILCQSSDPSGWFYKAQSPGQKAMQSDGRLIAGIGVGALVVGAVLSIANNTRWSVVQAGATGTAQGTSDESLYVVLDPRENRLGLGGRF